MNRIVMLGRLSKDVFYKVLPNGTELAKSSLAVHDRRTDKTTFIDITFFNGLAGIANKFLRKGKKIVVDGRLEQSKYKDKYGNNRYNYEIIVQELEMLDDAQDNRRNVQNTRDTQRSQDVTNWNDYQPIEINEEEIPF